MRRLLDDRMSGADIIAEQIADGARREAFGAAWTDYTDAEGTTTEVRSLGEGLELMRAAAEKRRREGYYDLIQRVENPTFEDTFQGIFDEALALLIDRQRKYGSRNITEQGLFGVFQRIEKDKMSRLRRAFNGQIVNGEVELAPVADGAGDEPFEDTLKDIANYALIMLALYRGEWGRPLGDET